jgi:alkanesulfonate monooxygenase SsuD/methylene tetrahydromethanopterin reductase-like flavin-dependent oxidoreductase (luciferase family)
MLAGERPTFSGAHYRVNEAMAEPRFRDHVPLLIGGQGEKKTIPLAAKHFDHLNLTASFDELPHKVDVVRRACEAIGRDPATLETSSIVIALVDEKATIDMVPEEARSNVLVGSPEQIAEQIKVKVLDAGIGGVVLSPVTHINGYEPGKITDVAEALKPLLKG